MASQTAAAPSSLSPFLATAVEHAVNNLFNSTLDADSGSATAMLHQLTNFQGNNVTSNGIMPLPTPNVSCSAGEDGHTMHGDSGDMTMMMGDMSSTMAMVRRN
jgi:hypothetical protein